LLAGDPPYIPGVSNRAPALFWKLQIAGWGAFYVAMSLSRVGRFPLAYMLVEKAVLTALGLGASLLLRRILRPMVARHESMPKLIAACVAIGYALTAIWTALFNLAALPITEAMLGQSYALNSVGALFSGTVYHAFALVAWGFLYIGIKHYDAWRTERENALQAQALAAEARLAALQSQLNPHFFFNALNAVSTLITERRNDEAASMIARLGDLLRATFGREGSASIPFAEELELAQRYLDIERVRLDERLRVELDVEEDAYDARVPALILQPLLENAIRHGIAKLTEGGELSLKAAIVTVDGIRVLTVTIENSAPAMADAGAPVAGVGLANVRDRLEITYGSQQRFASARTERGTWRVEFAIPAAGVKQSESR
jgi:two-component system LytT family sensor kinase